MKKLFAIFLTLSVSTAMAQIEVGVRGAFNAATMNKFDLIENLTPDFKMMPSAGAAVFLEIPITDNISFQPELAFTRKGFSIREGFDVGGDFLGINIPLNGTVSFKANYIEVPLLAKFHFGDKSAAHWYASLGPSIGYMADAKMGIKILKVLPLNTNLPNDIFKPIELSGIVAAGFELPVSEKVTAFVEGRYMHGFSRSFDTPVVEIPVRSRTLSGGLGLKFSL